MFGLPVWMFVLGVVVIIAVIIGVAKGHGDAIVTILCLVVLVPIIALSLFTILS